MGSLTFWKRSAAVLAISASALGTVAGAASAEPASAAAVSAESQAAAKVYTHTFSAGTTQGLYSAVLTGGTLAANGSCMKVAPGFLKFGCPVIAAFVTNYFIRNPPSGRCLEVSVTVGLPPSANGRYVTC
ncbi:hypothetical protein [Allokutzneria oryzae]|uniref:Uncharacterized protein n=1 Tax=Allokutzneria oryzae TaxID=1378989 RepID=A0ABV6A6B6_9PSEU